MRIELADATGCPVPQFVVCPETKEERMLLKAFLHLFNKRDEWKFQIHGFVHQNGEITSFNFGLATKMKTAVESE